MLRNRPLKKITIHITAMPSPEASATAKMSILPLYGDGKTWHEVDSWTIRGDETEITNEVRKHGK